MKLSYAATIAVFCTVGALAGCRVNGAPGNPTPESSKQQSVPQSATIPSEARAPAVVDAPAISARRSPEPDTGKLDAFATGGEKILMSGTGDLNGDGRIDAVIVVSPPGSGNDMLGEGPARIVMLLIRDENGQLRKVTQNDVIVPCEMCGGLAGDPFGDLRVDSGAFAIAINGGSRERWLNEYKFVYSPSLKDWLLVKIERRVSDRLSGEVKSRIFKKNDFGDIRFSDFEPSDDFILQDEKLAEFVPHGMRIFASAEGDINNDKNLDVVVVLEMKGEERATKDAPRTVLLLVRDPSGVLHTESRNDKLVPCADCGGMFGDPFSSISIKNGSITVVNEGGAGVYWSDEFTFTHVLDDGWRLSKAVRSVTLRGSAETSRISLSDEDFGSISFEAFDPKGLSKANLTD